MWSKTVHMWRYFWAIGIWKKRNFSDLQLKSMLCTCTQLMIKKVQQNRDIRLIFWNLAPPGMYKTSQKPENNRINMDKLQTSPDGIKTIFEPSTVTWPIVMFRVFQYVKIHHRHGIHKKPQLRHQIGAFRDGLPCFFLWTVSLCYRCEWFAKVWYAKKEFLWGLSVSKNAKWKHTKKKPSTFAHKCVFLQCPLNTLHLGLEYVGTLQRYNMTCFSTYQGCGLSAFHPWMAWTKSKHVTTAITTFKSWLFIDNSWQHNKWIQMVLWWEVWP